MKATSTNEKDWTPREIELVAGIRADGNDVRCTIKGGRRCFEIIEAEDGKRPMLRTNGGGIKIGAENCTVRLTGRPKK